MNIEEQFKADIENNRLHPVFPDEHDDLFEEHEEGHYLLLTSNDKGLSVLRIIFDNGNVYDIEQDSGSISLIGTLPQCAFIHRYLQILIRDYCSQNNLPLSVSGDVMCAANEVSARPFVRAIIDRENRWIGITNFYLPLEYRHKNLGKNFLRTVFELCQEFQFRLLLLDCVPIFYNRMVARGAVVISDDDDLEITSATDLNPHN